MAAPAVILAAAAALAGASVQSATGFGFALVLSPALFAALDPQEAITALLALGFALNLLVLADGGLAPVRWRLLAPVLAAALPGLALGAALLALLPKPALQIAVGVAVVGAAGWQLRRRVAAPQRPAIEPSRGAALAVGLTSGTLTTSISISGPPIVLWLEALRLRPVETRASLAAAFLALNAAGGAVVLAAGDGDSVSLAVLAPLLGLVVAGHLLGALAFRRLDPERFSTAVVAIVACAGLASVAAGVLAA